MLDLTAHAGSEGAVMQSFSELGRLLLQFVSAHRLPALGILMLLEEAGIPIPIPGDTLIMLAGAAPHKAIGYIALTLIISSVAAFIGSSILYGLVRRGGRPQLEKYGKYIHLNERRLQGMEAWFKRRGTSAIIMGRLIPGLRMPTTIMAGLADVPYKAYAPANALATVIWSAFYFIVGAVFQREWGLLSSVISSVLEDVSGSIVWILLLVALLGLGGGTWHARRRTQHDYRKYMHALLHMKKAPSLERPPGVDSAMR
jgi:membrane protein DedA with SNARE-associated domain